jgi:hypothetical protein
VNVGSGGGSAVKESEEASEGGGAHGMVKDMELPSEVKVDDDDEAEVGEDDEAPSPREGEEQVSASSDLMNSCDDSVGTG